MGFFKRFSTLRCSTWVLTLLVSTYLLLVFNGIFFTTVLEIHGLHNWQDVAYFASLFMLLLAIINLFLTLFALPWLFKPVLIVILVSASFATYFMQTYNVMIDKNMIQNTLQTDLAESRELLSLHMLTYVLITGLIPALLVARITVNYGRPLHFILTKASSLVLSIAVIGVVSIAFYQDYASLFRNHRYVRNLIVPVNYIYSLQAYSRQLLPQNQPLFQKLGEDAQQGPSWRNPSGKKVVSVLIVGETARSASFSLFEYGRSTNPRLQQQDLVRFSNFHSCGTSTAVSLPCMFSNMDRANFDNTRASASENLLDVLQRSGLKVVWVDNNSGCKGVCDRVDNETISSGVLAGDCEDGECHDMVLLEQLQKVIAESDRDLVVVLHQKGSHGPAYFLRTPKEFQQYSPFCHTNQLQECSQQEIVNAYDNTILYTDFFVSQVIEFLQSQQQTIDASMMYVSDHGESLGENNIFLHGLPYLLAPDEQTHVPLLLWLGDGFSRRFSIDSDCLQSKSGERFEHDNLFDSMLGMLDVQTSAYRQRKDIFSSCHLHVEPSQVAKALTTKG